MDRKELYIGIGGVAVTVFGIWYARRGAVNTTTPVVQSQAPIPPLEPLSGGSLDLTAGGLLGAPIGGGSGSGAPVVVGGAPAATNAPVADPNADPNNFNGTGLSIAQLIALNNPPAASTTSITAAQPDSTFVPSNQSVLASNNAAPGAGTPSNPIAGPGQNNVTGAVGNQVALLDNNAGPGIGTPSNPINVPISPAAVLASGGSVAGNQDVLAANNAAPPASIPGPGIATSPANIVAAGGTVAGNQDVLTLNNAAPPASVSPTSVGGNPAPAQPAAPPQSSFQFAQSNNIPLSVFQGANNFNGTGLSFEQLVALAHPAATPAPATQAAT